jgi:UDP-2-acetamido-3-amino-2,3-dideoxy-glucuronate N-acetyltransferase
MNSTEPGPAFYAHPTAVVDGLADIGAGSKIWHFSHIMRDTRLGTRCNIGQNVVISPHCVVGNNVKIQNNVSIYTGVTIEDDVFCGPSMVFTNVINPRSFIERKSEFKPTLVKRGASIGANATIVCGITLGQYCFVGAGATVTRDVPDYALVYGNPARLRGWVCYCGDALEIGHDAAQIQEASCGSCGRSYRREGRDVRPV